MKKLVTISILAIFVFSTFIGCKKGANDPFSLSSRKARIVGEWELSEADYKNVYNDGSQNYDFNGSMMTILQVSNGETDTYTYTYSETVKINKDGTFESEITKIYPDNGGTYHEEVEGLWYFLDGNDELEVKNKERVEFLALKSTRTYTSDGSTNTYFDEYDGKSNSNVFILLLDKLAKDQLITLFDYETRDEDGDFYSVEGSKTYEKQ